MKVTLIMLPGLSYEIDVIKTEKVADLFWHCEDLKDRLLNDLGKNLANKQIRFAIRHKESMEWSIYSLYQGCLQILQEGDTIMYSMLFGD